jgi:hypothetical protein
VIGHRLRSAGDGRATSVARLLESVPIP